MSSMEVDKLSLWVAAGWDKPGPHASRTGRFIATAL